MEDDNIRSLFADFDPDLSSSHQFMTRLEREIDNMEFVHMHLTAQRQRSRIAMAVAACVGCVVGFLLALCIPYFQSLIQGVSMPTMPDFVSRFAPEFNSITMILWVCIGVLVMGASVGSYELTLSLLPSARRKE
ncbi:MAG: hypothetical protein ACI304_07020 [Lepagella sp.]